MRDHERARSWFDEALSGTEQVGFAWVALLAFIRLTTNRVAARPWSVEDALTRIEAWLAQPNARIVEPSLRHAELVADYCASWAQLAT